MTTELSATHLSVTQGERFRARVMAEVSAVLAVGLAAVANTITDVGFTDVQVYSTPPPAWLPRASGSTAWPYTLLWIEATPRNSAVLNVELADGLQITDAWAVAGSLDGPHPLPGAGLPKWLVAGGGAALLALIATWLFRRGTLQCGNRSKRRFGRSR